MMDYVNSLWGALMVIYESVHAYLILTYLKRLRVVKHKVKSNELINQLSGLIFVAILFGLIHFLVFMVGFFLKTNVPPVIWHDIGTAGVVIHAFIIVIFNSWTRNVQFPATRPRPCTLPITQHNSTTQEVNSALLKSNATETQIS